MNFYLICVGSLLGLCHIIMTNRLMLSFFFIKHAHVAPFKLETLAGKN